MNSRLSEIISVLELEGGNVYYYGSYVRDDLMNIKSPKQLVVFNLSEDKLKTIMSNYQCKLIDAKKQQYLIDEENSLLTMPYTERFYERKNKKHVVKVDHELTLSEFAEQQLFTINTYYQAVNNSHKIIDCLDVFNDLKTKQIKAINIKTIKDDALNIYKACELAAYLKFEVDPNLLATFKLSFVKYVEQQELTCGLINVLKHSKQPSLYFKTLPESIRNYSYPIFKSSFNIDIFSKKMQLLDRAKELYHRDPEIVDVLLYILFYDFPLIYQKFEEKSELSEFMMINYADELNKINTYRGKKVEPMLFKLADRNNLNDVSLLFKCYAVLSPRLKTRTADGLIREYFRLQQLINNELDVIESQSDVDFIDETISQFKYGIYNGLKPDFAIKLAL